MTEYSGLILWGSGQKLKWEGGAIFALDNKSPDLTFRLLLGYEF
jgi:hypothetical protein